MCCLRVWESPVGTHVTAQISHVGAIRVEAGAKPQHCGTEAAGTGRLAGSPGLLSVCALRSDLMHWQQCCEAAAAGCVR
jgi:hypothetical protein